MPECEWAELSVHINLKVETICCCFDMQMKYDNHFE